MKDPNNVCYFTGYEIDYPAGQNEDYYDSRVEYEEPGKAQQVETLEQVDSSAPTFEQTPTVSSVSGFSIANAVNLRGKWFRFQKYSE